MSGIKTAVDQLLGALPAQDDDGQAQLFDPAEFEADVPMPVPAVQRSGPQGGRPKGARNKSTEQMRQYILSRYKHPLIALMEIASRSPKDLAEELGLYEYQYFEGEQIAEHLAVGEAFKRQMEALTAALPYLAQKQPIAIEQKGNGRGMLVLGDFKMQVNNVNAGGLPLPPEDGGELPVIDVSPLGGDPA